MLAERFGVTDRTISNIVENYRKNGNSAKISETFKPLLYSIWKEAKGDGVKHFGAFPAVFMGNLLYYHTEPMTSF
ncbi:MAG: hypothetical protein HQK97_01870 [Nitrospirae bacterium]|nr:hypothetical protein [Nitrospirota bacterium]